MTKYDPVTDLRDTERKMEQMRAQHFTTVYKGTTRARITTWNARYNQLNDRRLELKKILASPAVVE